MKNCPNCGAKINSIWDYNYLLSQQRVDSLNAMLEEADRKTHYCEKCAAPLERQKAELKRQKAAEAVAAEKQKAAEVAEIWAAIRSQVTHFPILTCPIPNGYNHEIKNSVISKMHEGKNLDTLVLDCKLDIMIQCINLGGNAVFSTTLNFLEVGSSVFYYQVIMMGTAVLIKDTSLQELSEESVKCISKIETLLTTLDNLEYTVSNEDKSVGNNRRMSRRREEIERQQRAAAADGGGWGE
jgi:hypothetical protein